MGLRGKRVEILLRIFWVPKQLQELGTSLIGSWPKLGIKKAQSEDKADLGTRPQDEAFNSAWLEAKGQQKVLSQGSGVQICSRQPPLAPSSAEPSLCLSAAVAEAAAVRLPSPKVTDAGQLWAEGGALLFPYL